MVGKGYKLIDFTSDGVYHYLRFEGFDHHRIIFRLKNEAETYHAAKILGYLVKVDIGYGERVKEFNKVLSALKAELKSSLVITDEPGVIKIDAEPISKYAYAIVGLYLDLGDYLLSTEGEIRVDDAKLGQHITHVAKALRDYLRAYLGVI